MTHWLDTIGIDKICKLVAMTRGMVTLTKAPDGTHTLWVYDWPMMRTDRTTARAAFANFVFDERIRTLYL